MEVRRSRSSGEHRVRESRGNASAYTLLPRGRVHGGRRLQGILWVTRCTGEMLDLPPLVLHTGSETVSYQLPMDWIESFNGAARDFIDGILTDRQPMMDIGFTEDVLRIILAMYQASDTRSWVAPSEVS